MTATLNFLYSDGTTETFDAAALYDDPLFSGPAGFTTVTFDLTVDPAVFEGYQGSSIYAYVPTFGAGPDGLALTDFKLDPVDAANLITTGELSLTLYDGLLEDMGAFQAAGNQYIDFGVFVDDGDFFLDVYNVINDSNFDHQGYYAEDEDSYDLIEFEPIKEGTVETLITANYTDGSTESTTVYNATSFDTDVEDWYSVFTDYRGSTQGKFLESLDLTTFYEDDHLDWYGDAAFAATLNQVNGVINFDVPVNTEGYMTISNNPYPGYWVAGTFIDIDFGDPDFVQEDTWQWIQNGIVFSQFGGAVDLAPLNVEFPLSLLGQDWDGTGPMTPFAVGDELEMRWIYDDAFSSGNSISVKLILEEDQDGDGYVSSLDPDDTDPAVGPTVPIDNLGEILGVPETICLDDDVDTFTLTVNDIDGIAVSQFGPEVYWTVTGNRPEGEGLREAFLTSPNSMTLTIDEEDFDFYTDLEVRVDYLDPFGDQTLFVSIPDPITECVSTPPVQPPSPPSGGGGGGGGTPPVVEPPVVEPPVVEPPVVAPPVVEEPTSRTLVIDTVAPRDEILGFSPRVLGETIGIETPDGFDFSDFEVKSVRNRKRLRRVAQTDVDFIFNRDNDKFYWNADGEDRGLKLVTDDGRLGGLIATIDVADTNNRLKTGMFYDILPAETQLA